MLMNFEALTDMNFSTKVSDRMELLEIHEGCTILFDDDDPFIIRLNETGIMHTLYCKFNYEAYVRYGLIKEIPLYENATPISKTISEEEVQKKEKSKLSYIIDTLKEIQDTQKEILKKLEKEN
jgi:hypothetical protein